VEALEDRTLPSTSIPLSAESWTTIGPAPLSNGVSYSGRIAALAADPTNVNTIYIAAAGGGVWKTADGGTTWAPLTDTQAILYMGAIAVAPSNPNVIYAGTGEANLGPSKLAISRDNIYYGRGILVSTDGGATWTLSGDTSNEFDRRTISKIVVDPLNANVVYAAVGAVATNGLPSNTGIWKSIDGGTTWTNTTTSISTTAAFSDVAMAPGNDQVLYAGVGNPFGDTANGIYETTNGGATWSLLSNFPHGSTDSNVGRITIAIAPTSAQTLYASIAQSGANSVLYKMMTSTNGGATWTLLANTPDYMGTYGDYDTTLAVDPASSSTVYAGGQAGNDLLRSTNGGASWVNISVGRDGNGPHVDHHGIGFDASGRFLDGDDGGIWRLDNPNLNTLHWTDLNGNLNTIQFTAVAQNPASANVAYGGSQDNGTEKFTDNLAWNEVDGGDGGVVHVSFTNPSTVYHDAAVASFGPTSFFLRSDDAGLIWNAKTTGINGNEPTVFYPPFVMDPSNSSRLLLGTSRVYETTNKGDLWTPLSTPGQGGWTASTAITALAAAPTSVNTIYATTAGRVFVTTNHGTTWTERDPVASPPSGLVFEGLLVDPSNSQIAYVTARSFSDLTGGPHVWMTTNGGVNWVNISGNLPDVPAWQIALLPVGTGAIKLNVLYLGTDIGVYFSTDQGATWSRLAGAMPNAPTVNLDLQSKLGILAGGTHGRGAWEIEIPHFTVTPSLTTVTAGSQFNLTVAALDPFKNVITNFTGTVHFQSNDLGATLPHDYTFTSADQGVHTFMGVILTKVGTDGIRGTDPVTSAAVGTAIIHVVAGSLDAVGISASGNHGNVPSSESGAAVMGAQQHGALSPDTDQTVMAGQTMLNSPAAGTDKTSATAGGHPTTSVNGAAAELLFLDPGRWWAWDRSFSVYAVTAAELVDPLA
jgi:hypothetical protein